MIHLLYTTPISPHFPLLLLLLSTANVSLKMCENRIHAKLEPSSNMNLDID